MNQLLLQILLIGVGATLITDVWGLLRKQLLGLPLPNYGLVGRWLAYMLKGKFYHRAITQSLPISGELTLGWIAHYLLGIAFAALLIGIWGDNWLASPTLIPALIVGIGTVVVPFLIMQPGMGLGWAGANTPNPGSVRVQSVFTHTVFGLGLYCTAYLLAAL